MLNPPFPRQPINDHPLSAKGRFNRLKSGLVWPAQPDLHGGFDLPDAVHWLCQYLQCQSGHPMLSAFQTLNSP